MALAPNKKAKIETHQIYNEAEEFIKEIETDREENSESLDDKLSEMNDAISDSKSINVDFSHSEKKETNKKDSDSNQLETIITTTNNSKSSNSYRLINREVIAFPNPVYTCESFGKVVLHIEVNANGCW